MTANLQELVLASGNAGKLREFSALLSPLHITLRPQSDFNVPECPEPFETFVENALAKARHAARCSGLPALADDSGICAPALGGMPGVHSARYAGAENRSDSANNAKLDAALTAAGDSSVFYVCVLVLVRHAADPLPVIADAVWHGQWQSVPSGDNGFGYDPHFFLPEQGKTAAAMLPEEKNSISHRARAMIRLLEKLQDVRLLNGRL